MSNLVLSSQDADTLRSEGRVVLVVEGDQSWPGAVRHDPSLGYFPQYHPPARYARLDAKCTALGWCGADGCSDCLGSGRKVVRAVTECDECADRGGSGRVPVSDSSGEPIRVTVRVLPTFNRLDGTREDSYVAQVRPRDGNPWYLIDRSNDTGSPLDLDPSPRPGVDYCVLVERIGGES